VKERVTAVGYVMELPILHELAADVGTRMVKYVLMADRLVAERHHDLLEIRELSEDEVEALSTALALVGSFNGSYSLYEICDQNYKET